ncbi:MAG: 3-phosphoglycerate dehydrogenase [Thaumarchaeota archaeon]|jgi:D-3-phosphoglycerate dehydrogenase|nr:3-phosphoglycerate dehydrogenase [Nitrososphaerota archaeon]|tara:strand:+ start:2227 stop:3198 length:972 start_codon:yes stop_codon:yes gene_type:complete
MRNKISHQLAIQEDEGNRVLVADSIGNGGLRIFKEAGLSYALEPTIEPNHLLEIIHNYSALIVRGRTKVTRELITKGHRLRVIGRAGVGLDNIDLEAATEAKVKVLNTPEAPTQAVAELVFGLLLALARGICNGDRSIKSKQWNKSSSLGTELFGKKLGVLGFGRIGRRVAELGKAFGMHVLGYDIIQVDPAVTSKLDVRIVDLHTMLRESDIVTLHIPLTAETTNLLSKNLLDMMKPGAFLINASRGGIIDENALYAALASKNLGGAALDVFGEEPPNSYKLVSLPNVVCTPHIGSQTRETQEAAGVEIAQKTINALGSKKL